MRASSLWLAALLGAIVGSLPSLVILFSLPLAEQPPTAMPAPDAADAVPPGADDVRLSELERRLAALEHTRVPAATAETVPAVDASATDLPLAERVEHLERLVEQLRAELAGLGPIPTTRAQIAKALEDRNLHGHQASAAQRQRRMELRRRWLELAPDDPNSAGHLRDLFNDTMVQNPDNALELLDRFAGPTGMPKYQTAMLRSNALQYSGRHDAARQIYLQARDALAANDQERVSAGFWYAYSYQREGRYEEAIAEFEALIAPWAGAEPPAAVQSSVAGAKTQIEKMRGWMRAKK